MRLTLNVDLSFNVALRSALGGFVSFRATKRSTANLMPRPGTPRCGYS